MNLVKLSDISNKITKGTTPHKDAFLGTEVNYIKSESLNYNGYIDTNIFNCIDMETHNTKLKRSILNEEDILVSIAGANLGKIGIISKEMLPANTNQAVGIISINSNLARSKYIYYYLQQNKIRNFVNNSVAQSAQPNINHAQLDNIIIELPELKIQDKIIKVLDIISNKIELNTHINNNLYEIGKALYQEYFESEKYTSNYEIKQLNQVTKNNRNKIDKNKEYKVLSAVNTGNLVLSDEYFDKQVYSKDIGKYLNVNKNDFAYNPARINIGSIGLNTFEYNCCVSPVYVTFSVDKDYIDFFDFYFKSKKFNTEVTLRASGSVRQALNYSDFGMIEMPYPTKEMVEKFNNSYRVIKNRINKNKAKISKLEQIRNTLLPKLMNGEIDLDKIEI
jgi:type I restriction enzyme S subunit